MMIPIQFPCPWSMNFKNYGEFDDNTPMDDRLSKREVDNSYLNVCTAILTKAQLNMNNGGYNEYPR